MSITSSPWRSLQVASILVLMTVLSAVGCDHSHADHAGSSAQSGLSLNHGVKWPTDASLRQAMSEVKKLVNAIPEGSASDAKQAAQVAAGVRAHVAFMVNNCKLEPEADAVLHILIADLMKGADEIEGSESKAQGLNRLRAALIAYPQYFSPTDE